MSSVKSLKITRLATLQQLDKRTVQWGLNRTRRGVYEEGDHKATRPTSRIPQCLRECDSWRDIVSWDQQLAPTSLTQHFCISPNNDLGNAWSRPSSRKIDLYSRERGEKWRYVSSDRRIPMEDELQTERENDSTRLIRGKTRRGVLSIRCTSRISCLFAWDISRRWWSLYSRASVCVPDVFEVSNRYFVTKTWSFVKKLLMARAQFDCIAGRGKHYFSNSNWDYDWFKINMLIFLLMVKKNTGKIKI